jgi:flavin reductase (DIM6/NTAB) family NADH-FMN oxidoreductase RutF
MTDSVTPAEFKAAMASFVAGVTVVTTADASGSPHALTATAFSSLSASPPLCLVCVDKRARAYQPLRDSGRFAVNILSAEQQALGVRFASSTTRDKFADIAWSRGRRTGCPILARALAWVECEIAEIYGGGDHDIFVGRLLDVSVHEGEPLVYFRGAYAALSERQQDDSDTRYA